MNTALLTRALAGTALLSATLTGCATESPRPTARSVATATPSPMPADFCGLITDALPDGWVLNEVKPDPYDNGALGISATCSLNSGSKDDQSTAVIVTWGPQPTVEEADESLTTTCDRVSRISASTGSIIEESPGLCQGVDQSDQPEWTLLGYTDPERTGVIEMRIDTSNPNHSKVLAESARQFAADLVTSIREE